jgi:type I restriction enzyme S subunit
MSMLSKWPIVSLGEVAELNPSRPRSLGQLSDDHIVSFVPMPAVDQHLGAITKAEARKFVEVKKGFTYFAENDVIFAKITPCMQNGKSAIAKGLYNGLGFGSTEFHVVRAHADRIIPEWIWYFVRRLEFRIEGIHQFRGGVGQQRVPIDYLANAQIPLPPVVEQQRIVGCVKECLDRVEDIKRLRSEAIVEADAVLPSMLNYEYHQLRSMYGSSEIGQVAEETRYGTSAKCTATPNGTAVLRIPNVAGGFVNFNDLKYCQLSEHDLSRLQLKQGDLLFVRTNGSRELVGRCAIYENESDSFAFASYLIRVRLASERMRPKFLAFFLNSTLGRAELDKRRRTSAGQFNINSENLRSIEVPVPPLDIQDSLISKLSTQQESVIKLRDGLSDVDAECSHLRESILRKAFAGEL